MQLMLHAHPRIAIPSENRFVFPSYMNRDAYGDLRVPENRRALARSICRPRRTQFRDFGLDAGAVIKEIVAGPPTVGSALGIVFRAYARKAGKPRWGDKRPGYHSYLPWILQMFPDAQIVHVLRDGRDCVASLKSMPWWTQGFETSVATWVQSVDSAARAQRRLPPGTFHLVRYERLVADPEGEGRRLCAFLGEEFDDAMTRPAESAESAVPAYKVWHARTHTAVSGAAVGRWRDRLEPAELGLAEAAMGGRLRRLGYAPATDAPRPATADLLRYERTLLRANGLVLGRRVRDRYRRQRSAAPVAALLTDGQRARLSARDAAWLAGEPAAPRTVAG